MQILEDCSSSIHGISFIQSVDTLFFNYPYVSKIISSFLLSNHVNNVPLSLIPHLCSLFVTRRSTFVSPLEKSLIVNNLHLKNNLRHNILYLFQVLTKMSKVAFDFSHASIETFLVRFAAIHCCHTRDKSNSTSPNIHILIVPLID